MNRLQTSAVVLARRPLGEADLVLSLLTRERGLLRAVAPSGRRSRKRFGGCLEPFGRVELVLQEPGRGDLWRLLEARLLAGRAGIRSDLVAIGQAAYLCELVEASLREGEEATAVADRLEQALEGLEAGPLDVAGLRRFELDLLDRLGLAPRLTACVACGAQRSPRWVLDPDQGGVLCAGCGRTGGGLPLPDEALAWLRALQAGRAPPPLEASSARIAREALDRLLARQLGRPLRSRSFLEALAREGKAGEPGSGCA